MHPKVSVVVPILNGAEYVPEIFSYLDDQTYRDFEAVMVVDVSSTDGSLDAALSVERDWLRVVQSGAQDAISGPRNLGMDHAEGEFVWFLDADDRPLPEFLERMMAIQQEHDADIVACNFVYSSNKRIDLRKGRYVFGTEVMGSEEAIRARAEERLPVTSWSKVFRLSLLRDNGIRFRRGWCEDIEHTYRALSCARTVCYTDEPLYIYYQHPRSFTNDPVNMDSRGGAEQEAYSRLPDEVMGVDGMGSKVALVRIRSSGHMTRRSFMEYARSEGCRAMLKRECSNPLIPEAMWYYLSPTTYYIAIRLFLRFLYYRDGRMFTKPSVRRGW